LAQKQAVKKGMSEGAMSTDVCKPDCSYLKRVQFGEGAMSTNIEKTTVIGQMVHCKPYS